MFFNKICYILTFATTLAATSAEESCSSSIHLGLDGGTCTTIDQVNDVIRNAFFANHKVDTVARSDENIFTSQGNDDESYLGAWVDDAMSYTIIHTIEDRRELQKEIIEDGRELQTEMCGTYCDCCGWTWCCIFCGWGCRRNRHLGSSENNKTQTDLIDEAELCNFLQTTGSHVFDGTCLEGATVGCTHKDDSNLFDNGEDVFALEVKPEENSVALEVKPEENSVALEVKPEENSVAIFDPKHSIKGLFAFFFVGLALN